MKTIVFATLVALTVVVFAGALHADVLIQDSFLIGAGEHTAGSAVIGQSCGTGWTGAWEDLGSGSAWWTDANGLVSTGGAGAGGTARLSAQLEAVPGDSAIARYPSAHTVQDGDTYWLSMMLMSNTTNTGARTFSNASTQVDGDALRFALYGADWGSDAGVWVRVSYPGTTYKLRDSVVPGQVEHFLAKIEVDAIGSMELMTFILNPTDLSSEAAALASAEASDQGAHDILAPGDSGWFSRFMAESIGFDGAGSSSAWDEIVVATTFGEVIIPEPSTIALLAAALAALAFWRRR